MEDTSDVKSVISLTSSSSAPSPSLSEHEELQSFEHAPPSWSSPKRLSTQLCMCETHRYIAWERRRWQILRQEKRKQKMNDTDDLTDGDLKELKGCIELGFGFNEEEGQKLCHTLPALDLYFAVNRQYSSSPLVSPNSSGWDTSPCSLFTNSIGACSSSLNSPTTSDSADSWKICSPGDSPQQVKMKLRHWAQAVACSVMQSQ